MRPSAAAFSFALFASSLALPDGEDDGIKKGSMDDFLGSEAGSLTEKNLAAFDGSSHRKHSGTGSELSTSSKGSKGSVETIWDYFSGPAVEPELTTDLHVVEIKGISAALKGFQENPKLPHADYKCEKGCECAVEASHKLVNCNIRSVHRRNHGHSGLTCNIDFNFVREVKKVKGKTVSKTNTFTGCTATVASDEGGVSI